MKWLYKYPQRAYPYVDLIETNKKRSRADLEYELIDTGIFNDDRYYDVFAEYAKESPQEILIKITVWNRGPELATLHLLPHFWFRNQWRIWMPVNLLLLRGLLLYYSYYGDDFKVECPTGSGRLMNLFEVVQEVAQRLMRTFLRDKNNQRPLYGGTPKFQTDPHWKDLILFYEYFMAIMEPELVRAIRLGGPGRLHWYFKCLRVIPNTN